MAVRGLLGVLLAIAVAGGCGGDDRPSMPGTDAGPVIPPASAAPQVAFEGHGRMAVEITASGADLSGATVALEDPESPIEILEQRCSGTRCGLLLRIEDARPNMGQPIPAPIDGENHFLSVQRGDMRWRALLSVRPLDAISNGGTSPLNVRGVQLAASVNAIAGSTFRASPDGEPVRWVVFGGGTMSGTLDVSAEGLEARAGGSAGGAPGAAGSGPGAGGAGTGGEGGGGAGAAGEGTAGEGADGTAGAGGSAGARAVSLECLGDFTVSACGGSGGGGGAAAGGAGGGALVLVSLAPLDLSGAILRSAGGDGADGAGGGGGGAGGSVLLAAPQVSGSFGVEVPGGAGGAGSGGGAGGAGAAGWARVELGAGGGAPADAWAGPAVDLSGIAQVTDVQTLTLAGTATPGASIDVADVAGGASATTTVGAGGAWSVDIALAPGLNRLGVTAADGEGTVRSWTGTNVEFQSVPGSVFPLPVGATIDVVYVP